VYVGEFDLNSNHVNMSLSGYDIFCNTVDVRMVVNLWGIFEGLFIVVGSLAGM
jgi:hypothetical protein